MTDEIIETDQLKIKEDKQPDIIAVAEERRKSLDDANAKLEDSLKKHDRLIAETIVRGKSFAGQKERSVQDEINDEAEKYANAMGRTFRK